MLFTDAFDAFAYAYAYDFMLPYATLYTPCFDFADVFAAEGASTSASSALYALLCATSGERGAR